MRLPSVRSPVLGRGGCRIAVHGFSQVAPTGRQLNYFPKGVVAVERISPVRKGNVRPRLFGCLPARKNTAQQVPTQDPCRMRHIAWNLSITTQNSSSSCGLLLLVAMERHSSMAPHIGNVALPFCCHFLAAFSTTPKRRQPRLQRMLSFCLRCRLEH